MRSSPRISILIATLLFCGVANSFGQTSSENGKKKENPGGGKPEKEPKEQVVKEDKPNAKDLVDSLTEGFQKKAEDYQTRQKDILNAMKAARGEERAKLRDLMKELQQTFKEEKEKFRDQVEEANEKLRLSDLKEKLKDEAREAREDRKSRDR